MHNAPSAAFNYKMALQQFLIAVYRIKFYGIIHFVIFKLHLSQVVGIVPGSRKPDGHKETFGVCCFSVDVDVQQVKGDHIDIFFSCQCPGNVFDVLEVIVRIIKPQSAEGFNQGFVRFRIVKYKSGHKMCVLKEEILFQCFHISTHINIGRVIFNQSVVFFCRTHRSFQNGIKRNRSLAKHA